MRKYAGSFNLNTCKSKIYVNLMLTYILRINDEVTTETDDNAMAAEAIQGFKVKPRGIKTPEIKNYILKCSSLYFLWITLFPNYFASLYL